MEEKRVFFTIDFYVWGVSSNIYLRLKMDSFHVKRTSFRQIYSTRDVS